MAEKQKTPPKRDELKSDQTWNLDPLYRDQKSWEEDFKKINGFLVDVNAFKGRLGEGAETVARLFVKSDEMERMIENLYVYAHLRADEDTAKSECQALMDRMSAKAAMINGELAWIDPELLALSDETLKRYLESDELKDYQRVLERLIKRKPHTLSTSEERILGMSSDVFGAPHKIFSMLNNADMKFPHIKDSDGDEIELTHGNYIKFLENEKRDVRESAFTALYDTYGKFRNTSAAMLNGTVKTHTLNARLRNFPSALAASLFPDDVSIDLYENLVSSVRGGIGVMHDYMDARRSIMKLEHLDMFDIHVPVVPESHIEVTWEQACEWVTNALKPLGETYVNDMKKAFTDRWIDPFECRGKRSGAYSSGSYDSPPYVLMNFNGTLNDVFTLAHELGHSMHSFYSNANQPYQYAQYKIFVAEVASTTNELLLHDYLMRESDDETLKTRLVNHLIDEIRGTVFRQTMFAEFEKHIHEEVEKGGALTPDSLCEYYFKLNADYHGDAVKPDKRIELEWSRIPHFYYNFYVYKYATGMTAAVALSKGILTGEKERLDAYLEFLKAGCSKDPLDILCEAGVDLTEKDAFQPVFERFGDAVENLKNKLV